MLVGRCTRCGKRYIGWALSEPEHQTCQQCGARLIVRNICETCEPDSKIAVSAQRDGIAEWPGSYSSFQKENYKNYNYIGFNIKLIKFILFAVSGLFIYWNG